MLKNIINSPRRIRKNSGFTLIELVVVIVVLGILAASAVPKFMDLQSSARVAYLEGLAGAIKSANNMLHAYSVIHGLDKLDLAKGTKFKDSMVMFQNGKVVQVFDDSSIHDKVFFLNLGYAAATNDPSRNHALTQILDMKASKDGNGDGVTVRNYVLTSNADILAKTCEKATKNPNHELCYMALNGEGSTWQVAYLVPVGYKAGECSLRYDVAYKSSSGTVVLPKITIISDAC